MNKTWFDDIGYRTCKYFRSQKDADAFTIAQNNGKSARQIVPHVHVHIIPRYSSMGVVWTKRKIVNDIELNSLAKKIRNRIE